jgi:hypothetical protein
MALMLGDLERVSRITTNQVLRDRILELVLDGELRTARRAEPVQRASAEQPAMLVTVKELATAMLAVVNIPYVARGVVSTRGTISRRFGAAFHGPKYYSKDGLQAVDAGAVADAFDALVCVMQNIAEIGPARLQRIVEKKMDVVEQFAG